MKKIGIIGALAMALGNGMDMFFSARKQKAKVVPIRPAAHGVININAPHAINMDDFATVWDAIVQHHGMPGGPAIERLHAELLARIDSKNRKAPTVLSATIGRGASINLVKRRAADLLTKPNEVVLRLRDPRWVWILTK